MRLVASYVTYIDPTKINYTGIGRMLQDVHIFDNRPVMGDNNLCADRTEINGILVVGCGIGSIPGPHRMSCSKLDNVTGTI